jgi:Periplasmic binding protein
MPDRNATDRLDTELRRIAEALVAEAPDVPKSLPANPVVVRLHGGPGRRYLLVVAVVVAVVSLVGALLAATRRGADDADVRVNQQPAVTGPPVGEAAPTCAGEAEGRLFIGSLLPETGDLAPLGAPMVAAASLAVEEINAAGGVLASPLRTSEAIRATATRAWRTSRSTLISPPGSTPSSAPRPPASRST